MQKGSQQAIFFHCYLQLQNIRWGAKAAENYYFCIIIACIDWDAADLGTSQWFALQIYQ